VVRSWSQAGESYLVDEGRAQTFEELHEIQTVKLVKRNHVLIDIAHRTNEVSQMCVKYGWKGLWGSDKNYFIWPDGKGGKISRFYSQESKRDAFMGTTMEGSGYFAPYVFWCNDPIKDSLAALRSSTVPGWWVNSNVSDAYRWQIDAEFKKEKRNPVTGRTTMIWHQGRKDNHLLDCELMQVVAAFILGLIVSPDKIK
jgi:hypothetical protein